MHVLTDYSVVRAPPFQRISLNPLRLVLLSIYLLVTYSLMSTPFYQLPKIHPNLQFRSITFYIKRTTLINHSLVYKLVHSIHVSNIIYIYSNIQFRSSTFNIKRTTIINHSLVKKHELKIHDSTTLSTPHST